MKGYERRFNAFPGKVVEHVVFNLVFQKQEQMSVERFDKWAK